MANYSKQKEAIREYLKGRCDHPTADQVFDAVKKEVPSISRGTVYRNLGILAEEGELEKVDVGDGAEHFDPNTSKPHGHFRCTKCGGISDIEVPRMKALATACTANIDATVEKVDVIFTGICKACQNKSKRKPRASK